MTIKKVKLNRKKPYTFNYNMKALVGSPTYIVELTQKELDILIKKLKEEN